MRYRVGLIGAGNITSEYDDPKSGYYLTHAHAISDSDVFSISGFYDIDERKGCDAARKWNTIAYHSIDEILLNSDVICCAVPDEEHYAVLKKSIQSDQLKAVICEKPITTNVDQAYSIINEYRERNIPIIVNYTRRFIDGINRSKRITEQWGEPFLVNCWYGKGFIHNGSHLINLLSYFFPLGKYHNISILDIVNDYYSEDPSIEFLMSDDNRNKIYFHVVSKDITSVFRIEMCFKEGRLIYDSTAEKINIFKVGNWEKYKGYTCYLSYESILTNRSDAMVNLYKEVFSALQHNGTDVSNGESALETLMFCQRIINTRREL